MEVRLLFGLPARKVPDTLQSRNKLYLKRNVTLADANLSATDEAGSIPVGRQTTPPKQAPRAYLNSARRDLDEEELKSPGAIRLLISECDRLDDRCQDLEKTEHAYNDLRVENAELRAKLKTSKWIEVMSGLCLASGSACAGLGFRILGINGAEGPGYILLAMALLLFLAGILSKVFK